MNVIKEIQRINEQEANRDIDGSGSWHNQYKDSAYLYVGGLPFELTEGDIICIFSQFGEILDINLIRDKKTGKSKGFCFIGYQDQRSTILAVDNLNGVKVMERTIRVDHVSQYKPPKDGDDPDAPRKFEYNAMPPTLEASSSDSNSAPENIDEEDPMAEYIRKRQEKRKAKKALKEGREKKSKKSKKDKKEDKDGRVKKERKEEKSRKEDENDQGKIEKRERSKRDSDYREDKSSRGERSSYRDDKYDKSERYSHDTKYEESRSSENRERSKRDSDYRDDNSSRGERSSYRDDKYERSERYSHSSKYEESRRKYRDDKY
ncbi:RNA-binding protein Cwf29 [Basidiobolus ranarum]|uniref:RNA-binding protein Cwf29 n=1 Tax=Basidiobolus ranarum TaxID=34480 RepID=A0ABR2WFI9_9FUNG